MFYQTQTRNRPPKGPKMKLFVPGDLDLDLETRPSEAPSTYSMQI